MAHDWKFDYIDHHNGEHMYTCTKCDDTRRTGYADPPEYGCIR